MQTNVTRFERTKRSPETYYVRPDEVLRDPLLDTDQKRDVLRTWRADAIEMAVAEEENMGGGETHRLGEVTDALNRLVENDLPETTDPDKMVMVAEMMRPIVNIVHADARLAEAATQLSSTDDNALLVADGDEIVGTVTREHLRCEESSATSKQWENGNPDTVRHVMNTRLVACSGRDAIVDVKAANMSPSERELVLVLDDNGSVIGVLNTRELQVQPRAANTGDLTEIVSGGRAKTSNPGGLDVYGDRLKTRS